MYRLYYFAQDGRAREEFYSTFAAAKERYMELKRQGVKSGVEKWK
jgi:hypothetical protein